MLRLAGGCMIMGGSLGLGLWYRAQFIGRVRALRSLRRILELFCGEVRFGRTTLPECCGQLAGYVEPGFREAFRQVEREMAENEGRSFGEVFAERTGAVLAALPLTREDREIFLQFTGQPGFADSAMQLRTLEQSIELLKAAEERLSSENTEKCRVVVGLGAMGGMFLVLLLL